MGLSASVHSSDGIYIAFDLDVSTGGPEIAVIRVVHHFVHATVGMVVIVPLSPLAGEGRVKEENCHQKNEQIFHIISTAIAGLYMPKKNGFNDYFHF